MRPVLFPDKTIVMPPRLCASVDYYAHVWRYGNYRQDWNGRFDKRDKDTHRFTIADTRGTLSLTVPIAKPTSSHCRWSEIEISTHGAWWDVHRVALESAYGRTPFFEFYIDRFLPMLTVGVEERYPRLSTLALAWDTQIRNILTLPQSEPQTETDCSAKSDQSGRSDLSDWSEKYERSEKSEQSDYPDLSEKSDISEFLPPYYQVRADKLGFIPHLSILDLIFNLGPESPLYLHSLTK